jgi:hypothetical protein
MITLSNGVKKPEDGEKGQPVFSALNGNFDILNDHTHDGSDSEQIPSSNLSKGSVNLSSGDWGSLLSDGSGYKQTVTLPGSYTLANCTLRFRVRTGSKLNKYIHPTMLPLSLTQFEVVVNDSSLDLEVLFI